MLPPDVADDVHVMLVVSLCLPYRVAHLIVRRRMHRTTAVAVASKAMVARTLASTTAMKSSSLS